MPLTVEDVFELPGKKTFRVFVFLPSLRCFLTGENVQVFSSHVPGKLAGAYFSPHTFSASMNPSENPGGVMSGLSGLGRGAQVASLLSALVERKEESRDCWQQNVMWRSRG